MWAILTFWYYSKALFKCQTPPLGVSVLACEGEQAPIHGWNRLWNRINSKVFDVTGIVERTNASTSITCASRLTVPYWCKLFIVFECFWCFVTFTSKVSGLLLATFASFDSPPPHPWNFMALRYEKIQANAGTLKCSAILQSLEANRLAVHFLMLERPLQSFPQGNFVLILSFVDELQPRCRHMPLISVDDGWRCQGDSTARIFASHFYRRLHCACSCLEYWTQILNWSCQLQKVWLMQKLKLFKRSKDIRLLTWRQWNRFSISSTLGL